MANPSGHTSTPQRVERVTNCHDCAFYEFDYEKCYAGDVAQIVPSDVRVDSAPPEWCPLRQGSILVVLVPKVPT